MNGLAVRKTITMSATADDWDLYTTSMDCSAAADALNRTLEDKVNSGATPRETCLAMYEVMRKYAHFGASDTEPRAYLYQLLDNIYGEEAEY